MPLPTELTDEQYEALEENKRGAFVKREGGGYRLDAEIEDVRALKNAQERLKTERRELKERLEARENFFRDLGVEDPEQLKALVEEHRKLESKKLIEAGEVDTLIAQREEAAVRRMREQAQEKERGYQTQVQSLTQRLNEELVDNRVLAGCQKHKARAKAHQDVLDRARRVFRVGDDGLVHPYNSDGSVMRNANGAEYTFDDFFTELQQTADHLFESNNGSGAANAVPSGGAASAVGNGAVPAGNLRKSLMTDEQKSAYVSKHGQAAFQALPR